MNKSESIVVFTHRSKGTLLQFKGSTSWKLNPERAGKCEYIICCQNTNSHLYKNSPDYGGRSIGVDDTQESYVKTNGEAFFIGKVSKIVPSFNSKDEGRWMVEFSEYATTSLPGYWKGHRNPVIYQDTDILLDWLAKEGIKPSFIKAPERDLEYMQEYFRGENEFWANWDANKFSERWKKDVQANNLETEQDEARRLRAITMKDEAQMSERVPTDYPAPEINPYSKNVNPLRNKKNSVKKVLGDENNPFLPTKNGVPPMSIGEAKQGLSKKYDIPINNIEIILKG